MAENHEWKPFDKFQTPFERPPSKWVFGMILPSGQALILHARGKEKRSVGPVPADIEFVSEEEVRGHIHHDYLHLLEFAEWLLKII